MDFNWVLVLGVVWFLMNLLSGVRRKTQPGPQVPRPQPQPPPAGRAPLRDATQREGSRLELVLRELERALGEADPLSRPTTVSLPPEEEIEERESLEREPEVVSLETEVRREPRRRVDHDDQAGNIEAGRIQAAAARDSARTKADHIAFDQRIRQEPADHTAARAYTPQQLRDAMVWREILGPPVSLRDESEK